jgi:SSS family solute:Na+ symporter
MSIVFIALIALSLLVALLSGRGGAHQKPEDFFVASGRFGSVLFFFLAVGETYSIATILGVPAGVFAHGTGFLAWFLGYILLAFPVGYFLYPCIWRAGRRTGAVTLPDVFRRHFDSRPLELAVALNAIVFLVPLGVMQFVGLDTVLAALEWPVPPLLLTGLAAALALGYVVISGIRAPAFVAVLKDLLMMLATLGPPPSPASWRTDLFAMSTIALQCVGFCLVPQTFATVFTARSVSTLRRAQVLMPLYMAMFPLLVAIAYAARRLTPAPGSVGAGSANDVFVGVARALLPGWAFGLVMAGAALSALVVLSGICLALGPLVARNLVPGLDGDRQRRLAKLVMALYLLLSIAGAARFHGLMVMINNVFYFGVTQALPGLVAVMALRRVRPSAIIAGLLLGDATAIALHAGSVPIGGLNPGLVGLAANAALLCLATALWPGQERVPTEAAQAALPRHRRTVSAAARSREPNADAIS